MESSWREVEFSKLCDIWRGGSPRPIHDWLASSGIPWVKISDASAAKSRFIDHTGSFIRPEGLRKSRPVIPGDLILSNSATPGLPMFMGIEACIHDGWLLLRNFRGIDKLFCYYLLLHERERIVQKGSGTVFTNLKTEILKNHVVTIPPLNEQKAIAHVLGTLDDKIELNRKMNQTLEGIARAIFKSWFVDFDPVRAKAAVRKQHPEWSNEQVSRVACLRQAKRGRQACPSLKPEIAELFPDSFVDSELGEIPKGWRVRPIGDTVKVVGGGTPSTKNPLFWKNGTHAFCTPRDMASLESPVLLKTERHITDSGIKRVSSGSLPPGTVLMSSRAPIGYLAISEIPVTVNQGIIAMICDRGLQNYYVLHWARENMDRILANANGSTFQEISKRNFRPITALIPDEKLLRQFSLLYNSLHERIVISLEENTVLISIRDTLLPSLLSGKTRVSKVRGVTEEESNGKAASQESKSNIVTAKKRRA